MAKARPFDAAEYLDSPEMIAAYINEALDLKTHRSSLLPSVRLPAPGMSAVAEKAGLSRENFYRALGGEAKPEFAPSSRCFMRWASIWLPGLRDRRWHKGGRFCAGFGMTKFAFRTTSRI